MSKCVECEKARSKYKDPREPPIGCGVCLCTGCWQGAAEERIEDLQEEINDLEQQMYIVGLKHKKL